MGLVVTTKPVEPGLVAYDRVLAIDVYQPENDVRKLGARSPAVIAIAGRHRLYVD
ncbi:hypothetical protein HV144_13045 [Citrobacter freundii]|nr:hypothetical protein [Citrobacter freundii]